MEGWKDRRIKDIEDGNTKRVEGRGNENKLEADSEVGAKGTVWR